MSHEVWKEYHSSLRSNAQREGYKHIHRLLHFGETPIPYILSERCDGTLSNLAYVEDCKFKEVGEVVGKQMLYALQYVHYMGLAHRDVKPTNIFYNRRGKNYVFYLADFGVATNKNISVPGMIREGTPYWYGPTFIKKGTSENEEGTSDIEEGNSENEEGNSENEEGNSENEEGNSENEEDTFIRISPINQDWFCLARTLLWFLVWHKDANAEYFMQEEDLEEFAKAKREPVLYNAAKPRVHPKFKPLFKYLEKPPPERPTTTQLPFILAPLAIGAAGGYFYRENKDKVNDQAVRLAGDAWGKVQEAHEDIQRKRAHDRVVNGLNRGFEGTLDWQQGSRAAPPHHYY